MAKAKTGETTRGWKVFFWVAAAYNTVIGAAGLVRPDAEPMERVASLLVVCFGLVYALVARDPLRFAPMLWAGIVGKAGVVAILLPPVLTGALPAATGAILLGDALFLLGFLAFLLTVPRPAKD